MFEAKYQFYPTPEDLIDQLVQPFLKRTKGGGYVYLPDAHCIMEPSAGAGAIPDRLIARGLAKKEQFIVCEIQEDLRFTLQGKNYSVVGTDFLEFDEPYRIDYIIMNPPFNAGVKHVLHAWRLLRDGGKLAAILNASAVQSPRTADERVLANLLAQHGYYEMAGRAFENSERPTGVEIVMLWLEKPEKEEFVFTGDGLTGDSDEQGWDFNDRALSPNDIVDSLAQQYHGAREALLAAVKAESEFAYYTDAVRQMPEGPAIAARGPQLTLNKRLRELKKLFWDYVFRKTRVGAVVTSKYRNKVLDYMNANTGLAFTKENVMIVLEEFILNRKQIMLQCILDVFDTVTAYHKKNTIHREGWKSNKSWMVARKIIYPYGVSYDDRLHGWWSVSRQRDFYDDIDKALCFVAGRPFPEITSSYDAISLHLDAVHKGQVAYNKPIESEFFRIKIHKKGTVHLEFLDEGVWRDFNRIAAQGKGWLGAGY